LTVSNEPGFFKSIGQTLQLWWKAWQKSQSEKRERERERTEKRREEERLKKEEFERTHEPCPVCDEQIQKGLSVCPECEAPFRDPAALQTWKLQQEVKQLREEAGKAREHAKKEKREKRGNNQGCGCILMLVALVVAFIFPPLGGILFVIGLVMLIVGLVS